MLTNILRRQRNLLFMFGLLALVLMPWSTILSGLTPPAAVYSAPAITSALGGVSITERVVNSTIGTLGVTARVRDRGSFYLGMKVHCERAPGNDGNIQVAFTVEVGSKSSGTKTYNVKGTCLDPNLEGINAALTKFFN